MRLTDPGRVELGSVGNNQHRWQPRDELNRHVQQLVRRRVDPMDILVDKEYWTLPR